MRSIIILLVGKFVIAYIEYIPVYFPSFETHVAQRRKVLCHLLEHKVYINRKKCEFYLTENLFLGHTVYQEGMAMNKVKVAAVIERPVAKTVKDLQRFLGLSNFHSRSFRSPALSLSP